MTWQFHMRSLQQQVTRLNWCLIPIWRHPGAHEPPRMICVLCRLQCQSVRPSAHLFVRLPGPVSRCSQTMRPRYDPITLIMVSQMRNITFGMLWRRRIQERGRHCPDKKTTQNNDSRANGEILRNHKLVGYRVVPDHQLDFIFRYDTTPQRHASKQTCAYCWQRENVAC